MILARNGPGYPAKGWRVRVYAIQSAYYTPVSLKWSCRTSSQRPTYVTKRAAKAPKPWPTLGASSMKEALANEKLSKDRLSKVIAMMT